MRNIISNCASNIDPPILKSNESSLFMIVISFPAVTQEIMQIIWKMDFCRTDTDTNGIDCIVDRL